MTEYNTIPMPLTRKLTSDEFVIICEAMFGDIKDQTGIAECFNLSQSSVSNFLRGVEISIRSSNKIAAKWNAFVENGGVRFDEADLNRSRPFAEVSMVRDLTNGRMYRKEQVESGLIAPAGSKVETDDQVVERIENRFDVMVNIVRRMLRRKINSAIVRAAPGVGKTFTIEQLLRAHKAENPDFNFEVLSGGGVSPFALFKALYRARNGGVVVLDDNDSFLDADESLNMLKNALDSSEVRTLTWSKNNRQVRDVHFEAEEDDDERIPSTFEFNGAMIFITNLDFQAIAESGSARSQHVAAMIDRSYYVNLTINTLRDKTLWCENVFMAHMYEKQGLSFDQAREIVDYVKDNATKFFIVSLRLFKECGELASDPEGGDWKNIIEVTKFKA